MKLPTSIENILNENIVENARLELKKNWNPEPILHTICAFANDIDNWGGGYTLIGVQEENGRPKMPITGLELSEIDKIQKELLAKCKLIQPSYTPIVDVAQYKGKNILVVWYFGGQTRPYKCPTTLDNVGLMFFNDEPQKFFPYSQIEVVDLRNGPEGDDMTEQIFKGPIDSMIKSALTYIKNTIIVEKILKIDGQAEAVRFFNYPYQAIEEALVNAVYHRGYDVREPVEVRIMEDRIHIVSYPGPDRSISEKSIEDKNMIARKYRNRRIGEFLKELKLTEGRNTGVPKIKRALKNNGSKEPEFETNETRDYFITTIFMHEGFENEVKDRPRTDQAPTKLNDQEIKILEFCKEPHSKKEIMEYMEYKHTRNFTMLYLKPLLEKGFLRMTIPEKPNHKNQKYIKIM